MPKTSNAQQKDTISGTTAIRKPLQKHLRALRRVPNVDLTAGWTGVEETVVQTDRHAVEKKSATY